MFQRKRWHLFGIKRLCVQLLIYCLVAFVTVTHFRSPVSIHPHGVEDVADHKWKKTQCSKVVHQAGLSDNRWDVECLPGLSTQEECAHACEHCTVYCVWWWTPAGEVLTTPYETCWRMITMENDYHLVSSLSLHVPSHCLPLSSISRFFFLLSHSAREVKCHSVSVVKAANHPHSECKATVAKETAIWLLGTWSCAHNSHFVA